MKGGGPLGRAGPTAGGDSRGTGCFGPAATPCLPKRTAEDQNMVIRTRAWQTPLQREQNEPVTSMKTHN